MDPVSPPPAERCKNKLSREVNSVIVEYLIVLCCTICIRIKVEERMELFSEDVVTIMDDRLD